MKNPWETYGKRSTCRRCGIEIEAERPVSSESPDPLWRTDKGYVNCPVSMTWHVASSSVLVDVDG